MSLVDRFERSRLANIHVNAAVEPAHVVTSGSSAPFVMSRETWDRAPSASVREGVRTTPRRGWALPDPQALAAAAKGALGVGAGGHIVALDVETTGLGAGTVPFVIGVLTGDAVDRTWSFRRWTLRKMGGEAAMLEHCVAHLGSLGAFTLLSYNGKSFDIPVLRGRARRMSVDAFALHGPHVDLLHPARRLWDSGRGSCRLQSLERSHLGVARVGDIAGADIPEVFWGSLMARDVRAARERLARVERHNALDLWSLVRLCEEVVDRLASPSSLREALAAAHPSAQQSPARVSALLEPWLARGGTALDRGPRALLEAAFRRRAEALRAMGDDAGLAQTLEAWLVVAPGDPGASRRLAILRERSFGDLAGALSVARASREPCERRISRLERRLKLRGERR